MIKNKTKTESESESESSETPLGELAIRTLAMPADANPDGDIFGGWLLSQMDIAGGIVSKQIAKSRTVTIAVNSMTFYRPVVVGDILCCYCSVQSIGKTSISLLVEAWVSRPTEIGSRVKVTEGIFTYVCIDATRRPKKITPSQE